MDTHNESDEQKNIKEIKAAINKRKYAHTDEINLLWQHALNSSTAISWGEIVRVSAVSSLMIAIISLLF